ncbi:hypothetical protein Y032_0020g123 [Ancylostoma ceylanicum]|uniref:RING-type domain-containing protein n=1 Tax=Ancylostoma ceylanicum TaxID=53326 RepID=A0A016V2D3_9BILA|nr:hypothetical protein Y032_0020g123 [Ancylostoma ceylanicum]
MPRLGVDPDYRFGDDLSLSSGLRSRSRSPLTYVGYTSKEEQEWQDHQLALRLQEEADRERQAVVEDTLDPEQIEAILGTSFDLPSRRNEPDSSDDVIILSETSSPSSLTRSNTPAQPALSRADREMYDGELTLLSEGENTEEDDSEDDDSPGEDVEESESDDNQVEEQSDDSEVEEMDDSEDDDDEAPNNDEDQESESSDSDSSDSDDEHDRLGLFRRILVQRNLDSLDSDDDEDRLSPELLSQILREKNGFKDRFEIIHVYAGISVLRCRICYYLNHEDGPLPLRLGLRRSLGPIVGDVSIAELEQIFEFRQRALPEVESQDSDEEEEEPDDTVIRSGDYGRCTICFEEVPYDPVGCIYCQQLIGCRRCVNRWYKAANRTDVDFMGGHPPSNHKQCPLCRHEWAEQVEVTSIFLLKDD